MAVLTGFREVAGEVVWRGVVSVDVAGLARGAYGRCVVESGSSPGGRVMAVFTGFWIIHGHMVWSRIEFVDVACLAGRAVGFGMVERGPAGPGRCVVAAFTGFREISGNVARGHVVVVDVALLTSDAVRGGMVERGDLPVFCGVTVAACLRVSVGHVRRRPLEIRLMASNAITVHAGNHAVVEADVAPGLGVVATGAILREAHRDVASG